MRWYYFDCSHNPRQWNALKLLNEHGEFLNAAEGNEVLRIAAAEEFEFADIEHIGKYREDNTYNQKHIDSVLALKLVDVEAIRKANFRVAIDCVTLLVVWYCLSCWSSWAYSMWKNCIANRLATSSIIRNLWKRTWVTSWA